MTLVEGIKWGIDILVSVGTGVLAGNITGKAVKNAKGFEKVCAALAAVAIEGLIAEKASGYLCDQIDDISGKIEAYRNRTDDNEGEDE